MKKIIAIFLLSLCFNGMAQQDAIYSQYIFNPFAINPAYAGSRNSYSAVLLHRSQWVGIEGAPTTQTLAVHAPLNKMNIAWGVNFSHDQLGPSRNVLAGATGAYHLKFTESKLAFGLRLGLYNTVMDRSLFNFKEDGDQFDVGGTESAIVPSFDFGVYYYKTRFFAGLSVNHITKHKFSFDDFPTNDNLYLRRHIMLSTGYVFEFSRKFIFKPSLLIKHANGAEPNLDLNLSFMFYKRFWLGVGVRNSSSINFMTDINVTDFMRVGYAFDLTVNALNPYTKGTHEVLIGFDFDVKNKQTVSPRYL